MQINLKLLHTFMLVAETNSFREAAEQARRSAPAISMQISRLEEQLGLALFHRTTRRVALTTDGERLLAATRRSLAELQSGLREIQGAAAMQHGSFTMAFTPSLAATRGPNLVATFEERYPNVQVNVREMPAARMLDSIRAQEISFGVGPRVDGRADLDFRVLRKDQLIAILPANSRIKTRDSAVTVRQLCRMPSVMLPEHGIVRPVFEELIRRRNLEVATRHVVSHAATVIAMVEAGLGAAILPRHSLGGQERVGLRVLCISDFPFSWEISLVTLRGYALSPAGARFARMIEDAIANRKDGTEP